MPRTVYLKGKNEKTGNVEHWKTYLGEHKFQHLIVIDPVLKTETWHGLSKWL